MTPTSRPTFRPTYATSKRRFLGALERAQVEGELGADKEPRALARFLTNAIHGLGILARGGADDLVLRDSIEVTLAVLA